MKSLKRKVIRDILCGSLIGDGSISNTRRTTPECSMHIGHCDEQLEYLDYKVSLIENILPVKFKRSRNVDTRNGKGYNHAVTRANRFFWKLRELFYSRHDVGSNRIIPKEFFEKYFGEYALTILILDDGNFDFQSSGLFRELGIYTLSYTKDEVEFLRDLINKRFGLEFKIRQRKYKDEYRYYLAMSSHERIKKVVDIIKPYVPECMNYKIYFDCRPVNSLASLRHLKSDDNGEYIVRRISK